MKSIIPNGYILLKTAFERYCRAQHASVWRQVEFSPREQEAMRPLGLDEEGWGARLAPGEFHREARMLPSARRLFRKKLELREVLEREPWANFRHALYSGQLVACQIDFDGVFSVIQATYWADEDFAVPRFSSPSARFYFNPNPLVISEVAIEGFSNANHIKDIVPIDRSNPVQSGIAEALGKKSKGGRMTKYDWLAIHVEIARFVTKAKTQIIQADVERHIQNWYPRRDLRPGEKRSSEEVDQTELKKSVKAFVHGLRPEV